MEPTAFSDARRIRPGERDQELELDSDHWPKSAPCPDGWESRRGGYLVRRVATDDKGQLACELQEAMLRFPAAPIHGLQRLHEGHNRAGLALNFHTYRVLTGTKFRRPVKRLFLLHNGLNELSRIGLYYELASHLIAEDPTGTACILRPFPGHLTRFPYHAFGEQPLDGYLWDGSHLFRQFVRHMVETQWFLSACVNRSDYRSLSGANLIAQGVDPEESRLDDTYLARAMEIAWNRLYDSSAVTLQKFLKTPEKGPGMKAKIGRMELFRQAVRSLRLYLGLRKYPRLNGELESGQVEPNIHVVGYSLGGFAAQSVFMSWPFVVDSCSTLLSGGPLRDLAPTAFADPEEWQTVLHSLRYELDEAMTTQRFDRTDSHIAGMEKDLFLYFQRTFYEVFQQEYHGSFQSRLAEFRSRMFFVVGGDDPIVRPQSVLDSGPPGGINLFEIAGLGHFIATEPTSAEERSQRSFWLPEVGKLITRFAGNASQVKRTSQDDTWLNQDSLVDQTSQAGGRERAVERLTESERGTADGGLPGELFERHLDDLLVRVREHPNGYLIILRNEVPAALLKPHSVQRRARALHHDDVRMAAYCRGVTRRWEFMKKNAERISLVLPWNAKKILERLDADHGFPSQSETAFGQVPAKGSPQVEWDECFARCKELTAECSDAVRIFDGRTSLCADDPRPEIAELVAEGVRSINRKDQSIASDATLLVPSLPDCWIWVSPEFLHPDKYRSPEEVRRHLSELTVGALRDKDGALAHAIEHDELRIIRVSRARYNPRFRGRHVTELELVRTALLQSALCLAAAIPWEGYPWERDESPPRQRVTDGGVTPQA
jgi:hypothetical protein